MDIFKEYLGPLVRRAHQFASARFQEEMQKNGIDITGMQFLALKVTSSHEGIDQASLAEKIACDRATLGGIVDRLEAKLLISRKIDPNDRRAKLLSITDKGAELLKKMDPIMADLQTRNGGKLNQEELKTLRSLLLKMLDHDI